MSRITYIQPDGTTATFIADRGQSVMHVATENNVVGIVGECGGNAMCATCHVYVDSGPVDGLPPAGQEEIDMLDCVAAEMLESSRLSCQLQAIDGLTVRIPECQ